MEAAACSRSDALSRPAESCMQHCPQIAAHGKESMLPMQVLNTARNWRRALDETNMHIIAYHDKALHYKQAQASEKPKSTAMLCLGRQAAWQCLALAVLL